MLKVVYKSNNQKRKEINARNRSRVAYDLIKNLSQRVSAKKVFATEVDKSRIDGKRWNSRDCRPTAESYPIYIRIDERTYTSFSFRH